ncbi:MAG: translation elongation factor Ts [Acidobacteria bacterium]|nr:translation elongation factor Ts [Acidobacteriota bacterium]
MAITSEMVRNLREKTGAGMMECKKALTDAAGDEEKAIEILRKSGLASAKKREGRVAAEGAVNSYIHMGGKVGVLLEINCETDFVARSDDFQRFTRDVAMHICASEPQYVTRDEVPADVIEKNRTGYEGAVEFVGQNRMRTRIFEGFEARERDRIRQAEIDRTISDLVTQMTAKTGEKISIRRFTRYKLGEGLEKRVDDFAAEVAAMNQ